MSVEDLEDGKPQFSQEDFEKLQAENKDLKTKVNEFRDNNLKFKQEKEEADRVARERAESERLAQEEAARTNGSIKELEDSLTNNFNQKLSEKDEMINRLVNGQIESKKTALIEEYKGKFLPQHKIAGELMLKNMIDVSVDDAGAINTEFKTVAGETFSTDKNTWFNDHVEKQFPDMIAGIDMLGGGAGERKNNSGAVNKKLNKTELTQLANSDPVKYQQYIQQGN